MSAADALSRSVTTDSALPPEVDDRTAWYGSKLATSEEWIVRLSETEVAEVERVAEDLERAQVELTTITAANVPLPALRPRLQELLEEVLQGRGFALMKGLPVERWSRRKAAIAFLAIGVSSRPPAHAKCRRTFARARQRPGAFERRSEYANLSNS